MNQKIGKNFKLSDFLKRSDKDTIKISFSEIEKLLGFELPQSAKKHRAFWANSDSHTIALTWMSSGYEISNVDMQNNELEFSKTSVLQSAKKGCKEFFLNDEKFLLEVGYHDGRTFRLLKKTERGFIDFGGNQKRFIVLKLRQMCKENPFLDIKDDVRDYIDNYRPGNTQGQNSNTLARILYRLLP